VGRNLVIFQQIESLLKFLLSNCKYKYVQHGDARSPLDKVEVGGNQKQAMLGQLVRKYLSDVLVDAGAEIKEGELPESRPRLFGQIFPGDKWSPAGVALSTAAGVEGSSRP